MFTHECSHMNVHTWMFTHEYSQMNVHTWMFAHECSHTNVHTPMFTHECSAHEWFAHEWFAHEWFAHECSHMNVHTLMFTHECSHMVSLLHLQKLIRMNMPVLETGTVHFTTTLFALIRESLSIKMGPGIWFTLLCKLLGIQIGPA